MRKLILLSLFLLIIPFSSSANPFWVDDPNSCPSVDESEFSGQDCNPDDICGADGDGFALCFDTSTIVAPTANTTTTSNADDGSFDGGYLIDCFQDEDASAPFCYDSSSPTCDRNSTVHSTLFRDTICLGTDAGGGFGITRPGDCRTNYFQCDGGGSQDDCEILSGSSCGSGTGTIQLDECFDGSNGNCTRISDFLDCNDGDGDSNDITCNPGSPNDGCEINPGTSTNNSFSTYVTCTTFTCQGDRLDCDGGGDGGGEANGCEVDPGSSCSIGGLDGTVANQCPFLCVVDDVDYGTSGQEQKWSGSNPFLWFTQLGSGLIANLTGTGGDYWLLDNAGNTNQSGNVTANTGFMNLAWSFITDIPNLIYGIWTDNNDDGILISNGTAIGINGTALNESVTQIGLDAGFNNSDGTGGWTNDSTVTNTNLNVNITSTLNVTGNINSFGNIDVWF